MRRQLVTIALAAVLVGCGDATSPNARLSGTYVLRAVGDSAVPYVLRDYSTFRTIFVADSLVFDGRGHGWDTSILRDEAFDQLPVLPQQIVRIKFGYLIQDDAVTLTYDCPPFAECFSSPHGTLAADGHLELVIRLGTGSFVRLNTSPR